MIPCRLSSSIRLASASLLRHRVDSAHLEHPDMAPRPNCSRLALKLYLAPALLLMILLAGCGGGVPDEPAIQAVAAKLEYPHRVEKWQQAELAGGAAVMADSACFWMDTDGQLYAADGFAKQLAPALPFAPPVIDQEEIVTAIKDARPIHTQDSTISGQLPVDLISYRNNFNTHLENYIPGYKIKEYANDGHPLRPNLLWVHVTSRLNTRLETNANGSLIQATFLDRLQSKEDMFLVYGASSFMMAICPAANSLDLTEKLLEISHQAEANPGEAQSFTSHGVIFTLTITGPVDFAFIRLDARPEA